jgi:IS6 family transposase
VAATGQFCTRAPAPGTRPAEVTPDRAPAYLRVLDELLPAAYHVVDQYSNNPIETDHDQLKSRLPSMHGRKRLQSVRVINTGRTLRAKPPPRPCRPRTAVVTVRVG